MGKNDRFQIIYTQGITDITRILLDTRSYNTHRNVLEGRKFVLFRRNVCHRRRLRVGVYLAEWIWKFLPVETGIVMR